MLLSKNSIIGDFVTIGLEGKEMENTERVGRGSGYCPLFAAQILLPAHEKTAYTPLSVYAAKG